MTPSQAINGALRKVPAWTIYIGIAAWVVWLFYLGLTGGLGVEPINALEREYGALGLKLLILGLLVTPLRKWTGVNLIKFRRAIGVTSFFMILAHFLVWAVLDVQTFARVWMEIVKRPYVTVGMVAFVLLIPLAATSNNLSVRRLGAARWRKLHKLTYPAAILGGVHYLWLVKGFQIEPIIYLIVILGLVATRYTSIGWRRQAV
ncbi:protein-methionine-sulfoxide reductase heme-binding subunit MsrQ [Yoonia sp.]|jgi:sulfoxide reductase heme-binding subunit YedZ|uniref:protein-methionine-sulfoxide reductase heme-binding subunit MsrQ n=1 Tax=Yoonia sp. TaxID=2212373 RepID=UPI0025FFAD0A|nr:protein-methionine-sulfoxide reductase heme-binding subunit MsrQ [Yoonia sp.]